MVARIVVFLILMGVGFVVNATPSIQNWQTKNDARVFFVYAPELPMVDVRLVFDAGGARDGNKPGLALMTNGMMPEGAGGLDASAIAERFEGVGASFGNSSHRDMSVFSVRSLTDKKLLDVALNTFSTVLSAPSFPQSALDRERKRLLVALEQQKQSPDSISDEALFKAIYGKHPYGQPPEGTESSVKTLSRSDLQNFYKRYMVGNNAIISIVGAVKRKQAEAIAEQIIGKLPKGKVAKKLEDVIDLKKADTVLIDFPSSQSHVSIAQPGMRRGDPDYFALYLGNHILGGSGLVSVLSDEIREKRGLSYSAYSGFSPMRANGPFIMSLQTRNDKREEALAVMREVLANFVKNGPSSKQLNKAKKNLTGGFALKVASNKSIVDYVAMIGFYGLPLDYLDKFIDNVNGVTVDAIKDAFERRVNPQKMVTVIVGANAQEKSAAAN